ncbi:TetR family transcriptional regulator [Marinobacter sp. CA1]|uniref:TetR family transcriptional regulator n=1 Tax=Marinobacter sp. CA1 TaxID=2817656 RepID=UPI001D07DDB3|nr:TetR family transcriptional regulator [Marinobacter sp. CA1]MCG8519344.1 TetR family transcriptional regulator [Pseudomonadales bacterium]UDL05194.1 TetR family transcriptional regulator [Marinobacter sp. CA1]
MSVMSAGKLKLIQAALKLATESRSLTSLGLRELAREAGLNPNTFYRHFRNLDELGLQVLGYIADELKTGVRELRNVADTSDQAVASTVSFVYRYFLENRAATTVAVRELYGPSPLLRRALENQLDASAREMAEDILNLRLVSSRLPQATVLEISHMTIRYLLFRAMDYIEKPEQRLAIQQESERFINRQFRGALLDQLDAAELEALAASIEHR